MAKSTLRSVLAPTANVRDVRKTLAPRAVAGKLRNRVDWLRFARRVPVDPWPNLVWVGSPYGGYVVPLELVNHDWICYSGGLGEDITFELGLIDASGCSVYGFDPIPRAAAHVARAAAADGRFSFAPVGLWSSDTTARFFLPSNPEHVSHSIANLQKTDGYVTAPCRSLRSLMGEFGHERIDLLKLDVEGAEYEVLKPVLSGDLTIRVLCVDFHKVASINHMADTVDRLRRLGYRPVHVHRTDVTFVRRE